MILWQPALCGPVSAGGRLMDFRTFLTISTVLWCCEQCPATSSPIANEPPGLCCFGICSFKNLCLWDSAEVISDAICWQIFCQIRPFTYIISLEGNSKDKEVCKKSQGIGNACHRKLNKSRKWAFPSHLFASWIFLYHRWSRPMWNTLSDLRCSKLGEITRLRAVYLGGGRAMTSPCNMCHLGT